VALGRNDISYNDSLRATPLRIAKEFIKLPFQEFFKDGGWCRTLEGYFINMAGTRGDWMMDLFENSN